MRILKWLWAAKPMTTSSSPSPRSRKARKQVRLLAEMLEDRTLPSTANLATLELFPPNPSPVNRSTTLVLTSYHFNFVNDNPALHTALNDLVVTTPFSTASPALFQKLASGSSYDQAVLTQENATGAPVTVWTLSKVYVSSDAIADDYVKLPDETIHFAFTSITETTKTQTASWDQALNVIRAPAGLPAGVVLSALPSQPTSGMTLQLVPDGTLTTTPVTLAVNSFQFTFENSPVVQATPSGGTSNKASFDDLIVDVAFAADSPVLFQAVVTGHAFTKAVLLKKSGEGAYVSAWTMTTVKVTIDTIDGGAGAPAKEELHFSFHALTEATSAQTESWDQSINGAGTPAALPDGVTLAALTGGKGSSKVAPTATLQLIPDGRTTTVPVTIVLDSFSLGFENKTSIGSGTGGAGTGKAQLDALTVDAAFAVNSPLLFRTLTRGDTYQQAVLVQNNTAGQPVAAWTMTLVYIAKDEIHSAAGAPTGETLHIVYGAVTEATSSRAESWSALANQPGTPDSLPTGVTLKPIPASPATALTLRLLPMGGNAKPLVFTVADYSFEIENAKTFGSATTGAGSGKTKFDDLIVQMGFGADSPQLFHTLVTGSHYVSAQLLQQDGSGKTVAAWTMELVFVTSDAIDGVHAGALAETVHFTFGALTQATSGGAQSWSVVTNEAGTPAALPKSVTLAPVPTDKAAVTLQLIPDDITTTQTISLPLASYAFGFANVRTIGSATTGAGGGKTSFNELIATGSLTADTPVLFQTLTIGGHYDKANLIQTDAKGKPVAAWILRTIFATAETISGKNPSVPGVEWHFAFGAITEIASSNAKSWSQVFNQEGEADSLPSGVSLAPLAAPAGPVATLQLTPETNLGLVPLTLPLKSFQFGFQNPTSIGSGTSGAGGGKASFNDLVVTLDYSNASQELFRALAIGAHYDTAVLTKKNDLGKTVAAWALRLVYVTHDDIRSQGNKLPGETVHFVFGSVAEAVGVKGTGPKTGAWDQVLNALPDSDFDFGPLALAPLAAVPDIKVVAPNAIYDGAAHGVTSALVLGAGNLKLASLGDSRLSYTYYVGTSVTGAGSTSAPTRAGTYTVVAHFHSKDPAYLDADSAPVTFTITAAKLTVRGLTALEKVYDGTTTALLNTSEASLAGAVPGDDVTLNLASAVGVFAKKGPGKNIPVTISGVAVSGRDTSNYILIQPTTTQDILQAPPALPKVTVSSLTTLSGQTKLTFLVSLSGGPSKVPVTYDVFTADGTARAGTNYVGISTGDPHGGTITFAPGQTVQIVTVSLIRGSVSLLAGSKTFTLNISDPAHPTVPLATGVGTILPQFVGLGF